MLAGLLLLAGAAGATALLIWLQRDRRYHSSRQCCFGLRRLDR